MQNSPPQNYAIIRVIRICNQGYVYKNEALKSDCSGLASKAEYEFISNIKIVCEFGGHYQIQDTVNGHN